MPSLLFSPISVAKVLNFFLTKRKIIQKLWISPHRSLGSKNIPPPYKRVRAHEYARACVYI